MHKPGKKTGWRRWLVAGGLTLFGPKCLVCVAGYLALGVGLAPKAPELCGAVPPESPWLQWRYLVVVTALVGGVFGLMTTRAVGWVGKRHETSPPG